MEKHNDVLVICADGIRVDEQKIQVMLKNARRNSIIYALNKRYKLAQEEISALHDYLRYIEHKERKRKSA